MIDFTKFDESIKKDDMAKAIAEAKENGADFDAPKGKYIVRVEKMELKATKDGRPMFSVQLRVVEAAEDADEKVTEYLSHFKAKKPCLFMNRVIYGTKNDANMIASVLGWLDKLETETKAEFKNYSQFNDCILDIFEEVADSVELEVSYDPDAFNSVDIVEVFDI